MSATKLHGAAQAAPYMPDGMRKAGMALHHAASRFALVAPEEDPEKTYAALRQITLSCVACHAQYRLK
jgi:cytochrome c556